MNPEFIRNLWTELSKERLFAMPIILSLIFYLAYSQGGPASLGLDHAVHYLLFILLVIWGSGLAADAVFQEIQENTWETQRMTPLSAWSFTWGKLFGKTIFVWYGALFCTLAFLIGKWIYPAAFVWFDFFLLLLLGVVAQAFALWLALLFQAISAKRSRIRISLIQIFTIVVMSFTYMLIRQPKDYPLGLNWYHFNIPAEIFFLCSLSLLMIALFIGIHRLFKQALQLQIYPIGWTIFVICFTLYLSGFRMIPSILSLDLGKEGVSESVLQMWKWIIIYSNIITLNFLAGFFVPKNYIHDARWIEVIKQKKYKKAFALMPTWMINAVLSVVLLIPIILTLQSFHLSAEETQIRLILIGFSISLLGFMFRDIGIMYFLNWNVKAKKANLSSILYLIALYMFLPWILITLGIPRVQLPSVQPSLWMFQSKINYSYIAMVNALVYAQVILVAFFVYRRLQKNLIAKI